jgi:hypothetical protein
LEQVPPDFDGAEKDVLAALEDPSTGNDVETWCTVGMCYEKKYYFEAAKDSQAVELDTLCSYLVKSCLYYRNATSSKNDGLPRITMEQGKHMKRLLL